MDDGDRARRLADLVARAADGDERAWTELTDQLTPLLWSITRAHGLAGQDASDAVQIAWMRLLESIGTIREPARVGAWLATTTRHACLDLLRRRGRETPVGTPDELDRPVAAPVDAALLATERDAAVLRAFQQLSLTCQRLLRVLFYADPVPSYDEIAAGLDVPKGWIGPSRRRCLDKLGRLVGPEIAGGL